MSEADNSESTKDPPRRKRGTGTVIIAIDFGMARTGFAYSLPDGEIFAYTNWPACSSETKTETCILYDEQGHFHFGTDALNKYDESNEEDQNRSALFCDFKMTLFPRSQYGQPLPFGMAPQAVAVNRSRCESVQLISDLLAHCRDCAMKHFRGLSFEYTPEQMHWVFTVPAIWSQEAKDTMLEAARRAGFPMDRLRLVLEPEAAAFHCRFENQQAEAAIRPGTKYCVLDCGGGTVDIAVHQATDDGKVRSVCRPTGGAFGAKYVQQRFFAFLAEIFGEETLDRVRHSPYETLLRANWERAMHTLTPEDQIGSAKNIRLDFIEDLPGGLPAARKALERYNQKHGTAHTLNRSQRIALTSDRIAAFVEPAFAKIAALMWLPPDDPLHGTTILARHPDISFIFLVGGFAQSQLLQPYLLTALQAPLEANHIQIVRPTRPQAAVVMGGALLGRNPHLINSRVARYTLGVQVLTPWGERDFAAGTPTVHLDGVPHVANVFSPLVQIDEPIPFDHYFEKQYGFMSQAHTTAAVAIYALERPVGPREPVFVTECQTVFRKHVHRGRADASGMLTVRMYFGQERIRVTYIVGGRERELGGPEGFAPFGG